MAGARVLAFLLCAHEGDDLAVGTCSAKRLKSLVLSNLTDISAEIPIDLSQTFQQSESARFLSRPYLFTLRDG